MCGRCTCGGSTDPRTCSRCGGCCTCGGSTELRHCTGQCTRGGHNSYRSRSIIGSGGVWVYNGVREVVLHVQRLNSKRRLRSGLQGDPGLQEPAGHLEMRQPLGIVHRAESCLRVCELRTLQCHSNTDPLSARSAGDNSNRQCRRAQFNAVVGQHDLKHGSCSPPPWPVESLGYPKILGPA